MPWSLIPPQPGRSTKYRYRGTYCGIARDHSLGTSDERAAKRILATLKAQAERGELPEQSGKAPVVEGAITTFGEAALAYQMAQGPCAYLIPILDPKRGDWDRKPLATIDQNAIDTLAAKLYPESPASTRNRQLYTPVSAVMKRNGGIQIEIKRPKNWRLSKTGKMHLQPDQLPRLLDECYVEDPEFGLLCHTLAYTGMRIDEPLKAHVRDLDVRGRVIRLHDHTTKGRQARAVHLPPHVVEAFQKQPPRKVRLHSVKGRRWIKGEGGRAPDDAGVPWLQRSPDKKLFRFHQGGALRKMLARAMKRAGLRFPPRAGGFHIFCHTYGTWMCDPNFGGLDNYGLARTRRWADPRSAVDYVHKHVTEDARRADRMPAYTPGRRVTAKRVKVA